MFTFIHAGDLVNYQDHRNWNSFSRGAHYDKLLGLSNWKDGTWKGGLIIGYFPAKHKLIKATFCGLNSFSFVA